MIVRGLYSIQQTDRIMKSDELKGHAIEEISKQIANQIVTNFSESVTKEEPSPRYPYGRFYIDVDATAIKEPNIVEVTNPSNEGIQVIG